MPRERISSKEILAKERETDALPAQGRPVAGGCKQLRVSVKTCFRWREVCGGLMRDQVRRTKGLEQVYVRLRKAASDLTIDRQILKKLATGNFQARGPSPSDSIESAIVAQKD